MNEEVEKWKKRLGKKGPFYIYEVKNINEVLYDYQSINPPSTINVISKEYYVIWNDGYKTKYGMLKDHMSCRYGIKTISVLNGETMFDLWQGHNINDNIFEAMLVVRNEESTLPHLNLDDLVGLSH